MGLRLGRLGVEDKDWGSGWGWGEGSGSGSGAGSGLALKMSEPSVTSVTANSCSKGVTCSGLGLGLWD